MTSTQPADPKLEFTAVRLWRVLLRTEHDWKYRITCLQVNYAAVDEILVWHCNADTVFEYEHAKVSRVRSGDYTNRAARLSTWWFCIWTFWQHSLTKSTISDVQYTRFIPEDIRAYSSAILRVTETRCQDLIPVSLTVYAVHRKHIHRVYVLECFTERTVFFNCRLHNTRFQDDNANIVKRWISNIEQEQEITSLSYRWRRVCSVFWTRLIWWPG